MKSRAFQRILDLDPKEGDFFYVASRIPEDEEWDDDWVPEMDSTVGKYYPLDSIRTDSFRLDILEQCDAFNYPAPSLIYIGRTIIT